MAIEIKTGNLFGQFFHFNQMQIQNEFNFKDIIQKFGKRNDKYKIHSIPKKEAIVNGILFYLDDQKKTASIFRNYFLTNEIIIPHDIIYKGKKYIITQFNDSITGFQYIKSIKFASNSELQEINRDLLANTYLEEIFVPSNVRKICNGAFFQCYRLRKISFPQNSKLQIIEKNSFYLSSLESISIPSSIEELQEGWCNGTWLLKEVTIKPNNPIYTNYTNGLILGKSDKNSQIHDVLVFAPRNIVKLTIPDFIRIIDSYSFSFSTLKSIEISSKVKIINKSAFSNCCYLQKFVIKENSELERINDEAFYSSTLHEITIPSNVSFVGDSSFAQCKKLQKLLFPVDSKLSIIGNYAFKESSIVSIFLPSLKKIGIYAFSSCKNLKIIEFGINFINSNFFDEYTFDNTPNAIIMCPIMQ